MPYLLRLTICRLFVKYLGTSLFVVEKHHCVAVPEESHGKHRLENFIPREDQVQQWNLSKSLTFYSYYCKIINNFKSIHACLWQTLPSHSNMYLVSFQQFRNQHMFSLLFVLNLKSEYSQVIVKWIQGG